ncbi:MAG: tetratricopeptide repeat protein [Sphingomonas sp.]|uniref:ATP-binding protein n=1 Tax=Sphingomonas sp. TaxID=28214 RepID=UPI0025E721C2|nr:ATP-binding protein [Sphingomonas sp.]MBX3565295.1 tetratricopeptide repeat protein [Sphingomonas sp.]
MRIPRLLFALLLAVIASVPAHAAEPPFPAPVEAAFKRAKQSMMSDPDGTLREIAAAEALAQRIGDTRQRTLALATAHWLAAEAHLRSNAPDKAGPMLAEALRMIQSVREPIKLRGDLLMSQGAYFMQSDKAAQALKNFQDAFEVFNKAGEPRSQAIALQNIALLYSAANDNDSAEKYFKRAAGAYSGDPALSVSLHNNRGNVLMVLERYSEAEAEYNAGLALVRSMDNPLLEARVLGNLARNQVEARKFTAAQATLSRGFALTKGVGASAMRRHLLATAARLAADQGDLARARRLIDECFAGLDLKDTGVELRTAHLYAYRIYREIGDLRTALTHMEALRRLNDEAAKVATTTSAALSAAKFDFQGKELEIEKLNSEQLRKTAQFQRTLFLSIGLATLIVIAALAWGLLTMRRSRNKVAAANIELGESNAALEKALKAKTEFLATTSHEIRTPLNGILGMTQVMLSDPKLDPQTRDRIGIAHSAGVTMRALVDDILDVAKIETGNLTVETTPMDLRAMLQDVTRMWQEQAVAKGLAFRLELTHAPCWIMSDAGRLRQIVFNLLSNAIKFTEKGAVTVRAIDEGEGAARRLKLVIADTGIGIPADKFDDIFESFRQVDTSTTRKFGGTGLGLTICRNLAQALGGDIHVESNEGQGSRFIVDLPLVPAEAPAAVEGPGAATGNSMLILDRNPIARSMLKTLFEPRVATLRFAASPEEARIMLGDGGVTHLLIDEATAKAGEDEVMATIQMLAAAAGDAAITVLWLKPEDETKSQLFAAGAGQIVEKPVAGAALIEAVTPRAEEKSPPSDTDRLATRAA